MASESAQKGKRVSLIFFINFIWENQHYSKKIVNFAKENWFKIALLIAIFWFLLILQDGIEIYHRGWIEQRGAILPSLRL
ncbi:MAG: hypothetical protein A3A80_02105 [Candidatus Terrybacteria bacterium RIFCSPLOWO2_01_FULL_44_24]|uniref:Uncharacterized protein n=1 Tax=Candidatus Terrybacteria bacterium RIFCSPHIGHO2_01_FULL_43_35 TaxID=1802361 RepID=A0A1G2PE73_9BACT|nr:MAG: hypothetical protein A2828_01895 [Candidatus Terrybacteria bacterium RIFCSPHIGHO2_01_FULL_43_35]OHA50873.1 MAG: hypothetical protein A3A80_02105 [Candidatus Terrybacteria bacterium RIFCSPLOWO2_01_FULL_44_24]